MHARICPACSKRHGELVAQNCPVCAGTGVVILGAAALSLHEPAVVSQAVALAIEAEARQIEAETTLTHDRVGSLKAKLSLLVNSGLVSDRTSPRQKKTRHLHVVPDLPSTDASPAVVARTFAETAVEPIDETLTKAAPYIYQMGERPNVRGLPSLSAAGYPSSTARIVDPMPVGTDTGAFALQRAAQARAARVLVEAAPIAADIKARRAASATEEGKAA